ncbi:MAG: alpha/beta hydrolase [Spirochaetia bacterium]|nr:alpha/beta hydrolase [Spirochaetia bacterium]MBQ3712372.1 alpha/beta hydrolase [Spirochaetia bacterium]
MNYLKFGNGAKTLVLIPGLSVQSVLLMGDAVARDYKFFTDDYTVYLIDRREDVPPVYTVADMARDTAEKMKELGLKDVCLLGASQGGMISMLIAAWYPELVHKLVLASSAARISDLGNSVIRGWISLAEKKDGPALYLDFLKKVYPSYMFDTYKDAFIAAGNSVTSEELEHFIIIAKGAENFDARSELSKIKCPVLVTGSEDDAVLGPEPSREIARTLGCQIHMYKDYGHDCYDTAPDYKEIIFKFFND